MSRRSRRRRFLSKAAPASRTDLRGMAMGQGDGMSGYAPTSSSEGNPVVMFGPSAPPAPLPIGGDPRQFQYRPGWNLPTLPGEGRLVSYQTLRAIADTDWALRKAIEVRKDEICRLNFRLMARDRNGRRARQTLREQSGKVSEIETFMARPDGRHSLSSWLRMVLEDYFVLDAMAFERRRNQDPDAGPKGPDGRRLGQLIGLDPVDAATIKVLLDDSGRLPQPPYPAFQQFIFGYPRGSFTTQEFTYVSQNDRTFQPYGFSRVEQFLYLVSVNLRFWANQGARYTEGTLPEGVVEAPEGWDRQQIQEYSDWWTNVLAGDPKALRKLQFVPAGFKFQQLKDPGFDEVLARFLLDLICVAIDVTPIELGLEPSHGGLGGKGLGETVERVQERRSLRPTLAFVFGDFMDPLVAEEFDAPEFQWTALELEEQSELERAQALDKNLRNGLIPLDEAIEEMGGEPAGIGRIFVVGPTMILGEPDLIRLSQEGSGAFAAPPTPAAPGAPPSSPSAPAAPNEEPAVASNPNSSAVMGPAQDARDAEITQSSQEKLVREDLRKWEIKATKAVKSGRPALTTFRSEVIPSSLEEAIRDHLAKAATPSDVKAAFSEAAVRTAVLERLEEAIGAELVGRTSAA